MEIDTNFCYANDAHNVMLAATIVLVIGLIIMIIKNTKKNNKHKSDMTKPFLPRNALSEKRGLSIACRLSVRL